MLEYPLPGQPAPGATIEVAPGVHWVRMPLPFALDHINLWVLEDGDGLTVVDTGYGSDETRAHWQQILAGLGKPVTRVIVTHCHPDHLGLAAWLAAPQAAPVAISLGEFHFAQGLWHQLPGLQVSDMLEQFRCNGLTGAPVAALDERGNAYAKGVPELPQHYHRLFGGASLRIGTHDWDLIAGYGHSPEHISLHCPELGLLISGDMLLPKISTNVSVFAVFPEDDPLGWFLDSLQSYRKLPVDTLVLPSHGRPFRGISSRVDALEQHHADRCGELKAAMQSPACAAELLPTLFPRPLDAHQTMFAMGEAIAHLNHLVHRGEARRSTDGEGIIRYACTD